MDDQPTILPTIDEATLVSEADVIRKDPEKEAKVIQKEAAHNRPLCDGCQEAIPIYPSVPYGYESPVIKRVEPKIIAGIAGTKYIKRVVCLECYRKDWKRKYKDVPCQV